MAKEYPAKEFLTFRRKVNFKFFNQSIRTLLIGSAFMHIGAGLLAPIYAIYVKQIGGSVLDASIAGGIFSLAAGIVTLSSAKLVDRSKNKKAIVTAGYLIMAFGYFLYIFVNSIAFLFIVQVIIGLASAFYTPAYDLLYTKHMPETKVGRIWGTWDAMDKFTIAFGAFFGGLVITFCGFNTMFILMSLLCLSGGMYIHFGLAKE